MKSRLQLAIIILLVASTTAFPQKLDWTALVDYVYPSAIHADKNGNVFSAGVFSSKQDFDWGTSALFLEPGKSIGSSSSTQPIFITKADASGNFVWAKVIRGAINSGVSNIMTDDNSNIYVIGYIRGGADFDPGIDSSIVIPSGNYFTSIFILKLNPGGEFLWVRHLDNTIDIEPYMWGAVDPTGNVYCSGLLSNAVDFDPSPDNHTLGALGVNTCFIAKYDPDGNYKWATTFGHFAAPQSIVADVDRVYVGGNFSDSFSVTTASGTKQLQNLGSSDAFLLKIKPTGEFEWAKSFGGSGADMIKSVALDESGNVYSTGCFENTADFNVGGTSINLSSTGSWDIFVQKLNGDGTSIWLRQIGGAQQDAGRHISVTNDGKVYIEAQSQQQVKINIGTTPYPTTGNGAFVFQINNAADRIAWIAEYTAVSLYSTARGDKFYANGRITIAADLDPGPGSTMVSGKDLGSMFIAQATVGSDDGTVTAIEQEQGQYAVYPNPVTNSGIVILRAPSQSSFSVRLRDMNNQIIGEYSFTGDSVNEIDIHDVSQGCYIAEFIDEKGNSIIRKLIKI